MEDLAKVEKKEISLEDIIPCTDYKDIHLFLYETRWKIKGSLEEIEFALHIRGNH